MPPAHSTFASQVDELFYFIFWVAVFFFVLILALAILFLVKYRRRGGEILVRESAHHNTALELVWSGVPLLIVLAIFVMGFRGFLNLHTPPPNAYEIQVTAQKWSWNFTYPNGYVDSDLHVPAGRPIKLVMSSQDVIHSLFVPQLRAKQDVVPGRYTSLWFEVDEPFEGTVFCAEYCGTRHSQMQARFVAHEETDFDRWLSKAADVLGTLPPARAGELLYTKRGCAQCHSADGSPRIGPSFKNAFGSRRAFSDGTSGAVDENYIRESILQPRAKVVVGYEPVMPTFQGRFSNKELDMIIAYIKSLAP